MKEKQELKKQLIILSIVLVLVIVLAVVLNMRDGNTESYTKIKDSTSQQGDTQNTSVDDFMDRLIMADIGVNTVMDFMDRLKGLVEENTTSDNNTIHYENTDIIQLDTGEIVLYSEDEQDNIDSQEE